MNSKKMSFPGFLALSFGSLLTYGVVFNPAIGAEPDSALKEIREVDSDNLFNAEFFSAEHPDFPGIGFPPGANTVLDIDHPAGAATYYIATPPKSQPPTGVTFTPLTISDSINMTFDSYSQQAKGYNLCRLFLLDADIGELTCVMGGTRNLMNPAKIRRFSIKNFGVTDPQGMAIDADSGHLYILDAAGPRIIAVKTKFRHDFSKAQFTVIDLPEPEALGDLRGLGFNPGDKHLYVLSTVKQKLYELALDGSLISSIDFSGLNIADVKSMVIAPSLDQTDSPLKNHLYLAISGGANGKVIEVEIPYPY